jgi:hypothetical protein
VGQPGVKSLAHALKPAFNPDGGHVANESLWQIDIQCEFEAPTLAAPCRLAYVPLCRLQCLIPRLLA